MNTLTAQYQLLKSKLIDRLRHQKYLCTTAVVWSSRSQSYFCATVHFINAEFKRESYVLAFRQMKYRQTNVEISKLIMQIFRDFKIDPNKITHVLTDGGSEFCKTHSLLQRKMMFSMKMIVWMSYLFWRLTRVPKCIVTQSI